MKTVKLIKIYSKYFNQLAKNKYNILLIFNYKINLYNYSLNQNRKNKNNFKKTK